MRKKSIFSWKNTIFSLKCKLHKKFNTKWRSLRQLCFKLLFFEQSLKPTHLLPHLTKFKKSRDFEK